MTTDDAKHHLARALLSIMRPLARLLLRNGISYGEFAEYARRAYVRSAMEDFRLQQRKPTISRAAVMTGLTRKEVKRIVESDDDRDDAQQSAHNRAARVVAGWLRDARFHARNGDVAALPVEADDEASFAELVRSHSGDMPARAVLDELARVGVAELGDDGHVHLRKRSYLPSGDDAQKLYILGVDVADLITTIDHNLTAASGDERFQRTVRYTNVPVEHMARWRAVASERGQELLEELDHILAPLDRDVSADPGGTGQVRTGISIFYFEQRQDADNDEG